MYISVKLVLMFAREERSKWKMSLRFFLDMCHINFSYLERCILFVWNLSFTEHLNSIKNIQHKEKAFLNWRFLKSLGSVLLSDGDEEGLAKKNVLHRCLIQSSKVSWWSNLTPTLVTEEEKRTTLLSSVALVNLVSFQQKELQFCCCLTLVNWFPSSS